MFRPSLTFARHLQLTSKRTVLSRKPNAPSRLFSKAPPPPLNSTADLSGLPAELTKGVGKRFNAPLSEGELVKLQEHVAKHGSWSKFYQETSNKWVQREVLLDWICRYDQFRGNSPIAANAVKALECVAASLLAVIGVTYSGLAGMNVVGCSVVGCAAALGGSTFSDIMTGRLARGGVFWARDPRFLALTLMSSLATFYALPSYETATATSLLNSIRSTAGLSPSSGISLPTFEKALVLSAELRENLKTVLLPRLDQDIQLAIKTSPSVEEEARIIFEVLDGDGNEVLDVSELLPLSRHTLTASKTFWYAESIALSSLSVVTAQSCIVRGLNPLSSIVIATLGGCVGGVMRDILCGRSMKEVRLKKLLRVELFELVEFIELLTQLVSLAVGPGELRDVHVHGRLGSNPHATNGHSWCQNPSEFPPVLRVHDDDRYSVVPRLQPVTVADLDIPTTKAS
ncbi:hypothetical protein TL16_g01008 [Triparma laevis f. inornata]|uniref:Glycine transporter domain-containing protein n=1 Tax=Triparma laevis f. inornata TaxID=1714386 RepID=A0A9W6ZJ09_9STRA|nr:hypothetical protein TL16_g01008 [Triparma laevis f. inornata]